MDSIDPLVWSVILVLVGCSLVILEVFVPSGGIVGFLALSSVLAAIVLAFYHHGPETGFLFVVIAVVSLPVTVVVAFHYWPKTRMGQRFLLGLPTRDEVLPNDNRERALKNLIGKTGIAETPMLLSGAVLIDGKKIDAVSQSLAIEAGQPVVVIEVRANRVVVRPATRDEKKIHLPTDDILNRPINELGIDPLDDPLA